MARRRPHGARPRLEDGQDDGDDKRDHMREGGSSLQMQAAIVGEFLCGGARDIRPRLLRRPLTPADGTPGGGTMAVVDSERFFENLERQFAIQPRGRPGDRSAAAWVLALLSVGAAVVHFAYSSAHFDEYWAYGAFFVAVAWLQTLWAFVIVTKKSRAVLVAGAALNVAVIAVWVLSRTVGVLVGPGASSSEAIGFPDVLATALEAALVVGAALVLVVPRWLVADRRRSWPTTLVLGLAVVAVAFGTAWAMTPSFASAHGHSAAGHVHGTGSALGTGIGAAHNHDQLAERQPDLPLDAATRAALAEQLTTARAVAMQYPTVADAQRAGFLLAGGFAPGSGAHYISIAGATGDIKSDQTVEVTKPGSFIYDGTSPTSRIVGLMYISTQASLPVGFAGPNDHWHRHANVCIRYGSGGIQVPFPADRDITRAQCDSVGGNFLRQTVWMVHAWVVPGWESPLGVFSHDNPNVRCADGTSRADARGFCQGT